MFDHTPQLFLTLAERLFGSLARRNVDRHERNADHFARFVESWLARSRGFSLARYS